jgi:Zn-dependent protease
VPADTTAALDRAAADIPLTRSARDVLERAASAAAGRSAAEADPLDVLRAVLASRGSLAADAMHQLGVDPGAVETALPSNGSQPNLPLRQLLLNANREAQVLGHYQVDSIHLLLALLYSDTPATSAALQKAGVTLYDLRRHLQTGVKGDAPVAARPTGVRPPDRALRRRPLPSLRGALGVSPIFLGLLAATAISGAMLWFGVLPQGLGILTLVFVVSGWVASVCVHEFGHALVAYLGGDRSVAASGYLTLNPLRYTNILMSVVLPVGFLLLGGIALPGGAVYIDRAALRSKRWDSAVSLAGPAGSLLCAVVTGVAFLVPWQLGYVNSTNAGFYAALAFLVFVEVFAVVLNLVPIPGLDGFGIIRPWLPYSVQATTNRLGMMPILLVFIVLWYVPPVREAFFMALFQITDLLGVPPGVISAGSGQMRL